MQKDYDLQATDYLTYRSDEMNSVALYTALMEIEAKPELKDGYRRMAAADTRHAHVWEEKMRAAGMAVLAPRLTGRRRTLIWFARRFGVRFILPTITATEQRDSVQYARVSAGDRITARGAFARTAATPDHGDDSLSA